MHAYADMNCNVKQTQVFSCETDGVADRRRADITYVTSPLH